MEQRKKIVPQNHFNIIDLALLLLALLAAVAIWQRQNLAFLLEGDRVKASYSVTVSVSSVRRDAAELLTADTALYVKSGNDTKELGRLLDDALVLPRTVLMPRGDGESAVEVLLPVGDEAELVDLHVTLICRGIIRDGALVLDNGVFLQPDMELRAFTDRGEWQISVLSIMENV